jgi:hypothetical protein
MEPVTADDKAGETARADKERQEAYKDAAVELGKGIALGLVPVLGQAIDVYDTIESALVLYNAKKKDDEEEAQFDLVLALVGWIPGPGDGVKKSLRLVNKDPQRFAPVLFDLLRFVLQECGIHTSPEALLQEIFNASRLKAQLDTIVQGIKESSTFQSLPEVAQRAVLSALDTAKASLPLMVLVVEKRVKKWTKKQPNSSAHESTSGHAKGQQPGSKQGAGSEGHARPASGSAGDSIRSTVATQALTELTNDVVGISGEHIADYTCAYTFGWGTDWKGHDDGAQGGWTEGAPGKNKLGKLSKGGHPKAQGVLYKLSDGANGTGIDAVWRAQGHNGGKPYAIVEAKASRNEDAPKFLRKLPSMAGTLGVVVKGELPITDLVQVIEPVEEDDASNAKKSPKTGSRSGGQKGAKGKGSGASPTPPATAKRLTEVIVQMSREWIRINVVKAVGSALERDILSGYSRHLFYAPRYHLSGSPDAHFKAKQQGLPVEQHAVHDAYHYDELKVKEAVNKRKTALRKKHGNLPSLKEER